jgi:hypothetical protein
MTVALVFINRTRLRVEIIADHAVQRKLRSGHSAGEASFYVRDIVGHGCCIRGL